MSTLHGARRLALGVGLLGALILPATSHAASSDPLRSAAGGQTVVGAQAGHLPSVSAASPRASSTTSGSELYIAGGGFGHGIGMSQYGALGFAEHGSSYRSILAHYYTGTALGQVSAAETVRVLIKTGSTAFSGATRVGTKTLRPRLTYRVTLAGSKLAVVDPSGKTVGTFAAPMVVTGSGPLTVAGLGSYRGALEFRPSGGGGVRTVNALGLDDYVRGVVAAEMPASWSAQALEAQGVAARTYAITTTVSGNGYGLYSDTRSQMYRGVAAETSATNAAVAATRGQVVTYHGSAVATLFFASSGGATENIEDVWSGAPADPWLRGVSDPYDSAGGNPYHHWNYTLTTGAAQSRLGSLVKGSFQGIRVVRHGFSPRIMSAQVVGSAGTTTVSGSTLAGVFGLLSTNVNFTTITTTAGVAASGASQRTAPTGWLPAKLAASVMGSVVPAFRGLAAAAGLHGTVLPGHAGGTVAVQQLSGTAWKTVTHATLSSVGAYSVRLGAAGRYRVVYHSFNGPTITVG